MIHTRDHLRQHWEEGEHTATVLHQEIAAKGYGGHYQRDKMAIAPLRRGLPIDTPMRATAITPPGHPLIATAPSRRDLHTTEALRRLLDHCRELARTDSLVRRFAAMLAARDARPLAHWLEQLSDAGLPALASLANAGWVLMRIAPEGGRASGCTGHRERGRTGQGVGCSVEAGEGLAVPPAWRPLRKAAASPGVAADTGACSRSCGGRKDPVRRVRVGRAGASVD